jgi:hypothetical protein
MFREMLAVFAKIANGYQAPCNADSMSLLGFIPLNIISKYVIK